MIRHTPSRSAPVRSASPGLRLRSAVAAVTAGLVLFSPAGATVTSAGRQAVTVEAGEDWNLTSPAQAGMDATILQGAWDYASVAERHTQGVVVTRGGNLVQEWYAPGEGPRSWGASWSMAKSFTSALVGIAIDEGLIGSVDQSMATWFPEWAGTPKARITLRDVLHMESGLKWNEDYDPTNMAASDIIQMGISRDQLAYAASRPVEVEPGTRWNYSSGDTMLLSWVIQSATGVPADEYAQRKLFDPIGIDQVEWWRDGAGHTLTYCCLDTTSRNYARMGLLYLRGGVWDGKQVVPAQWVADSLTPTENSGGQYGYQWWIKGVEGIDGPIYMMNGFDGQMTFIIPSLDLVVVRNGDYVKSQCAPVADPTLFGPYPPSNLAPGRGTRPPESWAAAEFLLPITESVVTDPQVDQTVPADQPDLSSRFPQGETTAPCEETTPSTTAPVTSTTRPGTPTTPPPATPIRDNPPPYTG